MYHRAFRGIVIAIDGAIFTKYLASLGVSAGGGTRDDRDSPWKGVDLA